MKLVTVAEMQAIERESNQLGWTYEQMMERAGQGLAEIVESFYGYEEARNALGLVGSGNNGGDTLIALERLARDGWQVCTCLVRPRPKDDPLVERVKGAGGELFQAADDVNFERLDGWLRQSSVVLDGVFGTGIKLPLRAEAATVLEHVKHFEGLPDVVAVDCPSGVDMDSGATAEETIPADITVCMAAVKIGLLNPPAYRLAGLIQVVDIGLPENLPAWQQLRWRVVTDEMVRQLMPERPVDGHKGTFGTVCVVAGSVNYTGAAYLCSAAAYRIGAGLVQIAGVAQLHAALAGKIPEAVWALLPNDSGVIAEQGMEVLAGQLDKASVLLWGPGLGMAEPTAAFVRRLVERRGFQGRPKGIGFVSAAGAGSESQERSLPPMIIDADGLKLMARVEGWWKKIPAVAVLTPHPGEMAILTGKSIGEIQADRPAIASRYAAEWGHVVVLKGAMTVIAEPGGQVRVIPVATSALAHAGTGDVLAGMIAGLRAQGMQPFEAATAGAWIHAQSGLLAAEQLGHEASVLAGNLIEALPEVLSWIW